MPDVLEMPYRPFIMNSGKAGEKLYTYRLGGPTCLAGDIIGDYSFAEPLKEGDKLVIYRYGYLLKVKTIPLMACRFPQFTFTALMEN